jgi:hypothetical protein
LSKTLLSRLGIAGSGYWRAITAVDGHFTYFLVRRDEAYQLLIDKSTPVTERDRPVITGMERVFRQTYSRLALERVAEALEASGTSWRIVEETESIVLEFGPSYTRSVRLTFGPGGVTEEEVSGVAGRACTDLTSMIEEVLTRESVELATVWKPEYSQTVEDEVMQVLRLHQ